jgi:hypothetical protein
MSVYADDFAGAYADVAAAGAAVTFTKVTTTQDDTTGAPNAPSTATVTGVAIRVKGDPIKYRDLGLTESEAPTLFFVPLAQGDLPALASTVSWGGETYTVRDLRPLDVDGQGAICVRIICAR